MLWMQTNTNTYQTPIGLLIFEVKCHVYTLENVVLLRGAFMRNHFYGSGDVV